MEMREGFWYSRHEPRLPDPCKCVDCDWSLRERARFVYILQSIEQRLLREEAVDGIDASQSVRRYLGHSSCRMCANHANGTLEFVHAGWCWPEGYRHYVEEHGVRPSLAFHEIVLGGEIEPEPSHAYEQIVDAAVKRICENEDRELMRRLRAAIGPAA